ncbi:MAG: iron-sulfur cluster assembly scaffold protein [Candidatus Gracilibacteria bacterium]
MDMYAENILDHFQHPRHKGAIITPTIELDDANPLCGDKLKLTLQVENGQIKDIGFEGSGCAISQAAMSMVAEELYGKNLTDAENITKETIYEMLGVPLSTARVKCALLSYALLKKALILLKHR